MVEVVIKRRGHAEPFDERKTYASVYAAALNCHWEDIDAENIAEETCKIVVPWVKDSKNISAHAIKQKVIEVCPDREVNLMYKHHDDLC